MKNKFKVAFSVLFITAASLCLLIAMVIAGPFIYNYYLSPLASLRDDIQIGQPFETVNSVCTEFYEKYREDDEIYITSGNTKDLTAKPGQAPRDGKYIHLYHWVFLDDLQLTIYFDKNDKVAHVSFFGD